MREHIITILVEDDWGRGHCDDKARSKEVCDLLGELRRRECDGCKEVTLVRDSFKANGDSGEQGEALVKWVLTDCEVKVKRRPLRKVNTIMYAI